MCARSGGVPGGAKAVVSHTLSCVPAQVAFPAPQSAVLVAGVAAHERQLDEILAEDPQARIYIYIYIYIYSILIFVILFTIFYVLTYNILHIYIR